MGRAGIRATFPTRMLRLELEQEFRRRSAVSEKSHNTLSAGLAGWGATTSFTFLNLEGLLDKLWVAHTAPNMFVVADGVR